MDWKDRVKQIKDKKERFRDKIDDREKKESPKELEKTKEYKNFQDAWKKLEDKKEEYKKKFSKKVKDYFKFMHDQLKEMYKDVGSPHELEDRDRENFYKQVRKEWKKKKADQKPLNTNMLGKFELTDHAINRMFERKVTPKRLMGILENGKQIKVEGPNYIITKGTLLIPLNTLKKKIYTVVRDEKYLNWTEEDFIRAQIARARARSRTASTGKVTVDKIKELDTLDDFLEFLGGEIPKEDPSEE